MCNNLNISDDGPSTIMGHIGTPPDITNSTVGPTFHPVFMPQTFTGFGWKLSDLSEQCDSTADVNNWDESLKLTFCLCFFQALSIYVIPKQIWHDLTKGGSELTGHQGDVSAANGGRMGIVGKWQTFCQLGSLASVAEILDILLGFDFLRKYDAVVDFWQKRVSNNK